MGFLAIVFGVILIAIIGYVFFQRGMGLAQYIMGLFGKKKE